MTGHRAARSVYRAELRDLRPNDRDLGAALRSVFGDVELVQREAHVFASSFPADVVSLRRADTSIDVLCKYSGGHVYDTCGHRGGVVYEARMYADVIGRLAADAPEYYGTHVDPGGASWLFTEFVTGACRADEALDPAAAICAAARWAARFHHAASLDRERLPEIVTYHESYYTNWALRTEEFAGEWHEKAPWLRALSTWFCDVGVVQLLGGPLTLIHGEYTPHNVLVQQGRLRPVDWESVALAAPEIDLASITEQWSPEVCAAAETAYRDERALDMDRLDAARVYWALRWLGHSEDWSRTDRAQRRLDHLAPLARRLGVT